MRTLFSALAVAGLLLVGAPAAIADEDTSTSAAPTEVTETTDTTEPTETTQAPPSTPEATDDAGLLGQTDLSLHGLAFAPDKKTYRPGDTFTATMTVSNSVLSDQWGVEGTFPKGLTVTAHTGLITVETGEGTIKGYGEGYLEPGKSATVTVTFRAAAETAGPVSFRVFGAKWSDENPGNNTAARDVVVAKQPPAPQPAPKPAPGTGGLANTGASALVPLVAGGALVLLGGGLLVAVRRRRT